MAPKLTAAQTSALGLVFVLRYTLNNGVNHIEKFGAYLDEYIKPQITDLENLFPSSFQHLEFAGCGTSTMMDHNLETYFWLNYSGLFCTGRTLDEFRAQFPDLDPQFFIPSMHSPDRFQLRFIREQVMRDDFRKTYHLSDNVIEQYVALLNSTRMSDEEIRRIVVEKRPYMAKLFDKWKESNLGQFSLTSVGIAIGHSNVRRYLNHDFADLGIWIK